MSNALIRLEQVAVTFAGQTVLDNIELSVEPGQIVTLIGPNGAGKTTLVRAVLGLLKPDTGSVWRKPKLRVGYMPQKLFVDPTLPLSVLRFLRLVPGVDRTRAQAALKEVGAEQVIDSPVQSISGGEMQRVLLARALLREPELLVLDEPVQGVDFSGEIALYDLIKSIRNTAGCGTTVTPSACNFSSASIFTFSISMVMASSVFPNAYTVSKSRISPFIKCRHRWAAGHSGSFSSTNVSTG